MKNSTLPNSMLTKRQRLYAKKVTGRLDVYEAIAEMYELIFAEGEANV